MTATSRLARLVAKLPPKVQTTVDRWLEIATLFAEIKDPKVAAPPHAPPAPPAPTLTV